MGVTFQLHIADGAARVKDERPEEQRTAPLPYYGPASR